MSLCLQFWGQLGYVFSFIRVHLQQQLSFECWDATLRGVVWEEVQDPICWGQVKHRVLGSTEIFLENTECIQHI